MAQRNEPARSLLNGPVAAINIGLEGFSETLASQGVAVVQVDWRPPGGGDPRLIAILDRLGG